MSQLSKPVWVWLPGHVQPVVCGEFTLKNGVGVFNYTDAYRALPQALALDPLHLPLTRSRRPFKETRQQGLFGVFRDASPEGFGLAMLERLRGQPLSDPLDRLEHAAGDGAGAIEVCDDLEAKLRFSPPPATALWDALAQLPTHRPSSLATQAVWGATGTSLGGERPKMTVLHQGQPWIAKLQEQGDPSHAPLREYAAMRVALQLGLEVAEVAFHRVGEREALLVRRFDRWMEDQGRTQRRLFASAHTVLRLDTPMRGEPSRSYVALAKDMQRFCASRSTDVVPMQRELWRRMVFNTVCGNGDDHPRNHGFIYQDDRWQLAPAFDIAPHPAYSGVQAMAITHTGSAIATQANLLLDSHRFGWDSQEALAFIRQAREAYMDGWSQIVQEQGVSANDLPAQDPMRWLVPA
jgi:serine/threonine-protein kinase HipA